MIFALNRYLGLKFGQKKFVLTERLSRLSSSLRSAVPFHFYVVAKLKTKFRYPSLIKTELRNIEIFLFSSSISNIKMAFDQISLNNGTVICKLFSFKSHFTSFGDC